MLIGVWQKVGSALKSTFVLRINLIAGRQFCAPKILPSTRPIPIYAILNGVQP
ncbi:MAG: hypothetical protein FMNOHCHN_00019 [Ignavibacteriaceae bacterium]|nr:hypothetical protein [Ignavibacteriaceae bacterium]